MYYARLSTAHHAARRPPPFYCSMSSFRGRDLPLSVAAAVGFAFGVIGWFGAASSQYSVSHSADECSDRGVVLHGQPNDVWIKGMPGPKGSCWCGKADGYCLCTPSLSIDLVVTIGEQVVFVKRANPPFGWAIPGGYVDVGETAEEAAKRELMEETGLDMPLYATPFVFFRSR